MKKLGILLLVAAVLGGGYYYYHTQLSSSFLDQKKITVGGKEYQTWSREGRERVGLTLRRIANKDNAAVLYVKASNVQEKAEGPVVDKLTYVLNNAWVDDSRFAKWYEKNEPCLRLIHKAVRKPHCEFPIFGSDEESAAAMALPMLAPMRNFARLLVCEGRRREHRREFDDALESYFAVTALAAHVRESNATLITELVGIACQVIGNRPIEQCLAGGKLSEQQIRLVLDHYLAVVKNHPTFAETMKCERKCLGDTIDQVIRRPEFLNKLLGLISGETTSVPSNVTQFVRENGPELRQACERSFDALVQWGSQPSWIALQPANHFDRYIERLPETDLFSRMFVKALVGSREQLAKLEAQDQGILIFAAIKLYEKKNGRPPATLAELKGDYLSELPKDPFSGRDYVYKVSGTDWILYSVWENMTDDGGQGSWPHNLGKDADLIWRNTPIPVQ